MSGPPPEPLYLFDGYNLLHAGPYRAVGELVDALASFVAVHGARGVVVFDGIGEDLERGALSVRYAAHADTLLERLAAEQREQRRVVLVTSDATLAAAAGLDVERVSSQGFFRELRPPRRDADRPHDIAGRLDAETRARLERLRRGE